MKSYACGSQAVYPPANIQDFHSRSYYKSYSTGHHHYSGRSFHSQQEQMNAYAQDRKHRQHHNIHTQNASGMLDKSSSSLQQQDGDTAAATATFSVTQLVNTQGHTQRSASSSSSASKATKKSANTSSAKSTKKESAAEKREAAAARGEDRKAKSSSSAALSGGSSRRSRSGGAASRSTYSTESLLQQANMENSHHGKSNEEEKQHKQSPYKNSSSSMKEKSNRGGMTSNWSNEVNQHFGSLSFTSLSPSPGLFSADLSSFEFGILNPQDGSLGGRDYLGMAGPGSSSSAGASQHINHQHSHHKLQHSKHQQQLACQLSAAANQRMPPSSAAAGSNSSSSVSDWTSSGGIIEGSFLPPLPTLTPPTEDPMAYTFMPHSHSGFYTSSVACTSSAALQKGQNVYTTQSSHTSVPGFSSSMSMMGKVHQNFGSGGSGSISSSSAAAGSHMAALTASSHKAGSSNTGSLVNFNLSTIFPEINIPPMVAAGPNCQTKPLVGLPPLPPPEFLQGSRASSSSQLGTPDLITSHHSLPILGHSSQVVTSFSVAPPGISSNIVHGLSFPNLHE